MDDSNDEVMTKLRSCEQIFASGLGALIGAGSGWLSGYALAYCVVVLPNRHLPVEQFVMKACGLGLSMGLLTWFMLTPLGMLAGVMAVNRLWQRDE